MGAEGIIDFEHHHDPDADLRAQTRALLEVGTGGWDDEVGPGLTRICVATTEELDVRETVVTLRTSAGSQAVAGASNARGQDLEQIQFGVGEGPGLDAFMAGRPVLVPDLTAAFARWPGYVPEALRAGLCAVFAFPLQLGAVRFGVLTAYADRTRSLTSQETTQALVFAELATELLLTSADGRHPARPGASLDDALHLRNEIYQAQGMVKVQLGVSLVEALARMRAHAFATGQDLPTLALDILAGTTHLAKDTP